MNQENAVAVGRLEERIAGLRDLLDEREACSKQAIQLARDEAQRALTEAASAYPSKDEVAAQLRGIESASGTAARQEAATAFEKAEALISEQTRNLKAVRDDFRKEVERAEEQLGEKIEDAKSSQTVTSVFGAAGIIIGVAGFIYGVVGAGG